MIPILKTTRAALIYAQCNNELAYPNYNLTLQPELTQGYTHSHPSRENTREIRASIACMILVTNQCEEPSL